MTNNSIFTQNRFVHAVFIKGNLKNAGVFVVDFNNILFMVSYWIVNHGVLIIIIVNHGIGGRVNKLVVT